MQMLSSESNEDWLKQEPKTFQNQSETNFVNDFGLDITSWTNNKQKKQQKNQQKKNNQNDIEKYYRKKELKKKSQLDQIVKYNQLAFSSTAMKQPLQKYQIEEKTFSKSKQPKLSKHQKNYQIQIQTEFSYFQNSNSMPSSQTFSESKNLLNQNKTSFKKISQKSIFMNIICIILIILANIVQTEFNILIVGLLIVEIIFCIICNFINSIFVPYDDSQKQIMNKQKQNFNVQYQQTYAKNVICIQRRLSFYQLFKYGIILVYFITIFNIVSQFMKTEQLNLKTFLVVLMGFLNFKLIKQIKRILFLEKQICFDYKRYNKQKLQQNLDQDQFDFS